MQVNTNNYRIYACILIFFVLMVKIPVVESALKTSPYILPSYYGMLIILLVFFIPRMHVLGKLRLQESILGLAVAGAFIFIALGFSVGLLFQSLAPSPYDLSPYGIFLNVLSILPALIVREMVRAYVLGVTRQIAKKPYLWASFLTLILAFTDINLSKISLLNSTETWFVYIAKDVLPYIVQSALLSVLAFYGGAKSSITYVASIHIFQRIFPVLPSIPWLAESAFGIAFPAFMSLVVYDQYLKLNRDLVLRGQSHLGRFAVALGFSVILVWFTVGVFPVYPSVVLTGSMEPMIYPGDVVLIEKISSEKEISALEVDDVISFKRETITITHRIVEVIYDEAGNVSFQTQGDNNTSPDDVIVLPNDINGLVTQVVPKVGLPVLLVYSGNPLPEGVLDN